MSDDDIFAGDVESRVMRIDRRVRAAALDAQCRDWAAERPDRVGFARLGQVHHEMRAAARRYTRLAPPADDWVWPLVSSVTWLATTLLVLLLANDPAAPLTLAAALVAGMIAGQTAITVLNAERNSRAKSAESSAAAIEDPYFYADLNRRIEACAAAARSEEKRPHRAAADDLGRALDWLAAARD
jgi:hypothetical protein